MEGGKKRGTESPLWRGLLGSEAQTQLSSENLSIDLFLLAKAFSTFTRTHLPPHRHRAWVRHRPWGITATHALAGEIERLGYPPVVANQWMHFPRSCILLSQYPREFVCVYLGVVSVYVCMFATGWGQDVSEYASPGIENKNSAINYFFSILILSVFKLLYSDSSCLIVEESVWFLDLSW